MEPRKRRPPLTSEMAEQAAARAAEILEEAHEILKRFRAGDDGAGDCLDADGACAGGDDNLHLAGLFSRHVKKHDLFIFVFVPGLRFGVAGGEVMSRFYLLCGYVIVITGWGLAEISRPPSATQNRSQDL